MSTQIRLTLLLFLFLARQLSFAETPTYEDVLSARIPVFSLKNKTLKEALKLLHDDAIAKNAKLSSGFKGFVLMDPTNLNEVSIIELELKDVTLSQVLSQLGICYSNTFRFVDGVVEIHGDHSESEHSKLYLLPLNQKTRQFFKVKEGDEIASIKASLSNLGIDPSSFIYRFEKGWGTVMCTGGRRSTELLASLVMIAMENLQVSKTEK